MIKNFSVCEVELLMVYLKTFLSAFGGGMAVVVATILFVKNRMEKLIDKKIDYHFDTKLENEKGIIEQKIYVNQHKFEKEYEIIQELMEKVFDFTYLSWEVYSTIGESDKDNSTLKKYEKMCDDFTLFYMKNCAFIPEELAKPFDLFVKKINELKNRQLPFCQSNRTIQLPPCFIILPQADLLLPVGVFLWLNNSHFYNNHDTKCSIQPKKLSTSLPH